MPFPLLISVLNNFIYRAHEAMGSFRKFSPA
jgi:hypothetical protein